jgi:hypothetical protein
MYTERIFDMCGRFAASASGYKNQEAGLAMTDRTMFLKFSARVY